MAIWNAYFVVVWYILWSFGIPTCRVLVRFTKETLATLIYMPNAFRMGYLWATFVAAICLKPGAQIGRMFAYWVIVFFGHSFKHRRRPNFGATFPTEKAMHLSWQKRLGLHFGQFFSQSHLGVDVMITIFGDKMAFFSKTNVMINLI
jgi:hypothetical protein